MKKIDKALVKVDKKVGELVPLSPLQRYIAEISRYTLLSREEEYELAVQLFDENDTSAANRLVTSNLRLVVKIAMEFQKNYSNILDLIQEGNVGLIHAVRKYDPYRGVKLSSYSAWWIRAYIMKFLMDNKSLVKIGKTGAQRRLFFNLKKEAEKLYNTDGAFDTKLLAQNLNVKESDVEDVRGRIFGSDVSLDAKVFENSTVSLQDVLPDQRISVDDRMIDDETKTRFQELLNGFKLTLGKKDRFIFENRLLKENPLTLQEIGDIYSFTRERARQLEKRILNKFKAFLKENDFFSHT